jgi:hypothetical protein
VTVRSSDYAEDRLKDLGVDGRIILKLIFKMEVLDCINVVQDSDRRRAVVNAVMKLRAP